MTFYNYIGVGSVSCTVLMYTYLLSGDDKMNRVRRTQHKYLWACAGEQTRANCLRDIRINLRSILYTSICLNGFQWRTGCDRRLAHVIAICIICVYIYHRAYVEEGDAKPKGAKQAASDGGLDNVWGHKERMKIYRE